MNLRTALLAGPDHGTDRLSIEADRRLRRRLGLESAPASAPRRVWLAPALAAFAVAAIATVVILQKRSSEPDQAVANGFVDVSKTPWNGTVTADTIDVHANSPASARITWRQTAIVASPDTRVTAHDGTLVLARGAIHLERTNKTPQIVDVPQGRVVIASYRSSITVGPESVTISLDDGSGDFIDADGTSHALSVGIPLVSPTPGASSGSSMPGSTTPATPGSGAPGAPGANVPPTPPPAPRRRDRASLQPMDPDPIDPGGPPGVVPPRPLRPDSPCTFKSDCDEGATCRKNEFGASVCMGNGAEGAPCWFGSDCLSNSCVQRRCER